MNRNEFMRRLEELLQDIPANEREEAIQYYGDYFEDAGEGREEELIKELESPEKVAAEIKAGLFDGEDGKNSGMFTERGFEDDRFHKKQEVSRKKQSGNSALKIILIVLLVLWALPFSFGALGVIIGIIAAFFGIFVAAGAIMAAAFIGGVAVIGTGIVQCFTMPSTGILLCGIGMLMLAAGFLILILNGWIFGKFLPWLIRSVTSFVGGLIHRKGAKV